MDEDAPQPDAQGWYEVPPHPEPRQPLLSDFYQAGWTYKRRYPRRIDDLEFIEHLKGDESDYADGLLDREFVSVLEIPEFSNGELSWQQAYEEVRGASHLSLANCRIFEITTAGIGGQTVQLWLDSEHPLQDSVFFNYSGNGDWCLVIRCVTHVRFHDLFGVIKEKRPIPGTENALPNFPHYVVQWGRKKAFTEAGTLHTVLLDEDGNNFEDDGTSELIEENTRYSAQNYYLRADRSVAQFPRFTYLNELSLMPHSPAVMRAANRVGKRWSEAFRRRHYRPRLGSNRGGRGYEKQRAEWNNELGGSSSTEPPPQPAPPPKRQLSEESQRQMLLSWKGSARRRREL